MYILKSDEIENWIFNRKISCGQRIKIKIPKSTIKMGMTERQRKKKRISSAFSCHRHCKLMHAKWNESIAKK